MAWHLLRHQSGKVSGTVEEWNRKRYIGYKEEVSEEATSVSLPLLRPGSIPLYSLPTPILERHSLHPAIVNVIRGRPSLCVYILSIAELVWPMCPLIESTALLLCWS